MQGGLVFGESQSRHDPPPSPYMNPNNCLGALQATARLGRAFLIRAFRVDIVEDVARAVISRVIRCGRKARDL